MFGWDYSNSIILKRLQTTRPLQNGAKKNPRAWAHKIERISIRNNSLVSIFEDDPLLYKVILSFTSKHFFLSSKYSMDTYDKLSSICYLFVSLRHFCFFPHGNVKSSSKAWIWHVRAIPLRTICCHSFWLVFFFSLWIVILDCLSFAIEYLFDYLFVFSFSQMNRCVTIADSNNICNDRLCGESSSRR